MLTRHVTRLPSAHARTRAAPTSVHTTMHAWLIVPDLLHEILRAEPKAESVYGSHGLHGTFHRATTYTAAVLVLACPQDTGIRCYGW